MVSMGDALKTRLLKCPFGKKRERHFFAGVSVMMIKLGTAGGKV